jgi:acetyltransferase
LRLSQLVHDFSFIDELDINPLLISEKTGEGIAVDGRIKVRMEEAKEYFRCNCGEGCECGEICTCNK